MAAFSEIQEKTRHWVNITLLILGFWLSASLILDFVIMPSLYITGMMTQSSFASAGYVIFWLFNRIELLCAGLALTGFLVLHQTRNWGRLAIILSSLLLCIAFVDTYVLTPQMSALGMQLNLFEQAVEVPTGMNQMHQGYWFLELLKLSACGILLSLGYRQIATVE